MAISFRKQEYKDEKGKVPSEYITELLNARIDVMKIATFMYHISNEGSLSGKGLYKLRKPPIGIWVRSQGKYRLMYSYYKDRNEVCFLLLFTGNPKLKLKEGIKRVKEFYNIK